MEPVEHPEEDLRPPSSSSGSGTDASPVEDDGEHALLLGQAGPSSEDGRTQPLLQVNKWDNMILARSLRYGMRFLLFYLRLII